MTSADSSGGACWSAAYYSLTDRLAGSMYRNRLSDVRHRALTLGLFMKRVKVADSMDASVADHAVR